LAPLLFNVYINDFPSILNDIAHAILYAHDTTVIVTSNDLNTLNDKLNIVMKRICSWFHNNHLVLNLGKTHLVKFTTPKSLEYTLSVTYNNLGLRADDNVKFLGMYLDCRLNWKHPENLVKS
jgi:hypothetical protein